jgi:VanZ like protein
MSQRTTVPRAIAATDAVLRSRLILGAFWGLAVAGLTLRPGGVSFHQLPVTPPQCLFCGARGSADAVLNILMFVPLGLIAGGTRKDILRAAGAGLVFSSSIEFAQLFLPGRYASVSDLLGNSAGAAAGAALLAVFRGSVAGTVKSGAYWAGLGVAAVFFQAGVLMKPAPTDADYWVGWTPDLSWMPQYDGQVLSAKLNGRSLPPYHPDRAGPHRDLLKDEWTLQGTIVLGSLSRSVSPILSIYDDHQREIVLLGVQRTDLVFRERTIAARLGFDTPDVRVPGVLASLAVSDTVGVAASRSGGVTCLSVGRERHCGVGVTPGRIWGLLLYLEGPTEVTRSVLDIIFLAGLFFPIGLLGLTWGQVIRGGVVAAGGLAAAVALTPLILGPWYQALAGAIGLGLGGLAFRIVTSVVERNYSDPLSIARSV